MESRFVVTSQWGPSIYSGFSPSAGLQIDPQSTHLLQDCYPQLELNPHCCEIRPPEVAGLQVHATIPSRYYNNCYHIYQKRFSRLSKKFKRISYYALKCKFCLYFLIKNADVSKTQLVRRVIQIFIWYSLGNVWLCQITSLWEFFDAISLDAKLTQRDYFNICFGLVFSILKMKVIWACIFDTISFHCTFSK